MTSLHDQEIIERTKVDCAITLWRTRLKFMDLAEIGALFGLTEKAIRHHALERTAKEKYCSGCKKSVPLSHFGKNSSRPDGKHHRCKACACEDMRRSRKPSANAWTEEEEQILYFLYVREWSWLAMARVIGRSAGACEIRAHNLGLRRPGVLRTGPHRRLKEL